MNVHVSFRRTAGIDHAGKHMYTGKGVHILIKVYKLQLRCTPTGILRRFITEWEPSRSPVRSKLFGKP